MVWIFYLRPECGKILNVNYLLISWVTLGEPLNLVALTYLFIITFYNACFNDRHVYPSNIKSSETGHRCF